MLHLVITQDLYKHLKTVLVKESRKKKSHNDKSTRSADNEPHEGDNTATPENSL